MLQIAFYKGTRPGLAGIYSRGVRIITKSKYSHCEIIFSDGMSASASFTDKGVRIKKIDYNPAHWDIVDLPLADEVAARKWFEERDGKAKYDLLGNIHFIFSVVGNEKKKWFCSEAVAEALGFIHSWRFDPGTLHAAIVALSAQGKVHQHNLAFAQVHHMVLAVG